MADEERARKLAAAKKKLKAYQSAEKQNSLKNRLEEKAKETPKLQNYFSNNENLSNDFLVPQQESQNEISKISVETPQEPTPPITSSAKTTPTVGVISTATTIATTKTVVKNDIFNPLEKPIQDSISNQINTMFNTSHLEKEKNQSIEKLNSSTSNSSELLKTIEILISEKADLSKESSRLQISCKEKDFEIEEINTRLKGATKRIEELEQYYFNEQKKNSGTVELIKNLESDLNKYKNQSEEFSEHIEELKRELSIDKARIIEMEKEIKEKNSQLELNNIRINQISDENNITIDNRIETLTQTKFMYEQQIVDLQTMVQQLRAEKEQANQQYQNYVQHLNKDLASLTEKNSELMEENTKLETRGRDLVDHIGNLEREIQQNIVKNENLRQNMKNACPNNEEVELQDNKLKIEIEELKKIEVDYKNTIEAKCQENAQYKQIIEEKLQQITLLEERVSQLESSRPNDAKLLASIESDKIAASRAMSQNSELRQQLDELQLKLIELTNDKMDLTNKLDSEKFTNKHTRQNFEEIQNQIKTLSDQLHFKDEEMIRLSHENNELNDKLIDLKNQLESKELIISKKSAHLNHNLDNEKNSEDPKSLTEEEINSCSHHLHHHNEKDNQEIQIGESISENGSKRKDSDTLSLPTSEAMWRLEERFKKLMGEVAELTDEKQQLEHLVLQLQGETETIGEYIALYQSQRKILKQKENERDAQLNRLLAEREDLRNKALQLDVLIKEIGLKSSDSISSHLVEMLNRQKTEMKNTPYAGNDESLTNGHHPNQTNITQDMENQQKINENYNNNIENQLNNKSNIGHHITESDSQKIIDRIQSLVSDLKNNKDTLPLISTSVDHCACCSGEFETI